MKTGLAIFCVIGLNIVFAVWDSAPVYHGVFPFSDQQLTYQTHVYFIFEHLTIITILYLWYYESAALTSDYVLMFLFIQIGNLADYLLRYNEPFLNIRGIPVSYNIVSIFLYSVFLIYKGWKDRSL
jgi:hypothetical protein